MENNKPTPSAISKGDLRTVRAQTRLRKRYSQLRDRGGYRALADEMSMNQKYVWEFVRRGVLPNNEELRERLLDWRSDGKKEKPLDDLMLRLHDLILVHKGVGCAIKKKDLLKELYGEGAAADESYNNVYDRRLRSMIERLIHDHGALICSTPRAGYFWAGTLSEGLACVERSEMRARKQLDNTGHLKRNLQLVFGGQLEIFREQGEGE